jgi:diaminohydroxyphosphoribosylaminopyrimidine deaminase / 5-amino-6-(5-phosphoribosylamino)uracil reductase
VRLKVAVSMDGRTALPDGRSRWVTDHPARVDGHAWRRRASAVLTGIGTLLTDDPRLDVRLVPTPAQPLRIVLDSHWRTPVTARFLAPPGSALVVGVDDDNDVLSELRRAGVETLRLPEGPGGVDLEALMRELGRRGINELHVEAGAQLNGRLLQEGWVDEIIVYLAPKLLGDGPGLAALAPSAGAAALLEPPQWRWHDTQAFGVDLRLRLRRSEGA